MTCAHQMNIARLFQHIIYRSRTRRHSFHYLLLLLLIFGENVQREWMFRFGCVVLIHKLYPFV